MKCIDFISNSKEIKLFFVNLSLDQHWHIITTRNIYKYFIKKKKNHGNMENRNINNMQKKDSLKVQVL